MNNHNNININNNNKKKEKKNINNKNKKNNNKRNNNNQKNKKLKKKFYKNKKKQFKNKENNNNKLLNNIININNNNNINNLISLHNSSEQYNIKKRNNYISWNDYFMSLAFLSAMRSKDPSTQVGACIVDQDNHIVSIGYNGFPSGICDDILPWSRECPLPHNNNEDSIEYNTLSDDILNDSQDVIHTHTSMNKTHEHNEYQHNENKDNENKDNNNNNNNNDEKNDIIHNKSDDCILNTKYPYVCHAEMNAILNKYTHTLEGCKIYIALFPCNECAKLIIQSGIKEVIYMSDKYHDTYTCIASRTLFDLCNVRYEQYIPTTKKLVIDFSAIDPTLF